MLTTDWLKRTIHDSSELSKQGSWIRSYSLSAVMLSEGERPSRNTPTLTDMPRCLREFPSASFLQTETPQRELPVAEVLTCAG